jgi:hypothetical protein
MEARSEVAMDKHVFLALAWMILAEKRQVEHAGIEDIALRDAAGNRVDKPLEVAAADTQQR